MAINNSSSTKSLLMMITIISFLLLVQNVKSAKFTFNSFDSYSKNIELQGNAFTSNGSIHLTSAFTLYSAGRASYAAPVRLWNAKTGQLAGFSTSFAFVVAPSASRPNPLLGDGISFFIAPYNSNIPKNSSGGFLGLFSAETALNTYENQIVAVEFDSYGKEFGGNPWDPNFSHVGIDINSIASVTTAEWQTGSAANGFTAIAYVNYVAETKNLSVYVQYPWSHVDESSSSSISYVIDLRTVLPEWVRVGFSGATGQLVELHKILSWSFSSSFK